MIIWRRNLFSQREGAAEAWKMLTAVTSKILI